jgi:hypothetical protein
MVGLTNPEKEAAHIRQALDLTEAAGRDGYAIFRESIHGDLSSSDDASSKSRWDLNNISSNSSTMPSNDESSSGSANGF